MDWIGLGYPILLWHQEHRSRAMLKSKAFHCQVDWGTWLGSHCAQASISSFCRSRAERFLKLGKLEKGLRAVILPKNVKVARCEIPSWTLSSVSSVQCNWAGGSVSAWHHLSPNYLVITPGCRRPFTVPSHEVLFLPINTYLPILTNPPSDLEEMH